MFIKVKTEGGRTTLDADRLIEHVNQHQVSGFNNTPVSKSDQLFETLRLSVQTEEGVFTGRPAVLPSDGSPPESENDVTEVCQEIKDFLNARPRKLISASCFLSRACYVPACAVDAQQTKSTDPGLRSVYTVLCCSSPRR